MDTIYIAATNDLFSPDWQTKIPVHKNFWEKPYGTGYSRYGRYPKDALATRFGLAERGEAGVSRCSLGSKEWVHSVESTKTR